MKRWVKKEIRKISKSFGAPEKKLRVAFRSIRERLVEAIGDEGATGHALHILHAAIKEEHKARTREAAEVDLGDGDDASRVVAVCLPGEVDAAIEEARTHVPGQEIECVSVAQIAKGPDRGRVMLCVRFKAEPTDPARLN